MSLRDVRTVTVIGDAPIVSIGAAAPAVVLGLLPDAARRCRAKDGPRRLPRLVPNGRLVSLAALVMPHLVLVQSRTLRLGVILARSPLFPSVVPVLFLGLVNNNAERSPPAEEGGTRRQARSSWG